MTQTVLDSGFREDLVTAHAGVVNGIAQPGTWWTGVERVAIATEVRRARADAERPPWEAPSSIDGMVDDDHPLPTAAVDAAWRISNHPGTLTASWYADIVAALPSPEHYVELVAIVAMTNSIDMFADVMDLDPVALPEPVLGEPSREAVAGVEVRHHWVPTADMPGSNVMKALTAVPADQSMFQPLAAAQYVPTAAVVGDLEWRRDGLDRRQIELVAALTSMANECFY